jgi:hypothetical protein
MSRETAGQMKIALNGRQAKNRSFSRRQAKNRSTEGKQIAAL